MDNVEKISHEIARVEESNLKAYADKDRVIFVVQDAPAELRKLADALEKINVREIQALVAYKVAKKDGGAKAAQKAAAKASAKPATPPGGSAGGVPPRSRPRK